MLLAGTCNCLCFSSFSHVLFPQKYFEMFIPLMKTSDQIESLARLFIHHQNLHEVYQYILKLENDIPSFVMSGKEIHELARFVISSIGANDPSEPPTEAEIQLLVDFFESFVDQETLEIHPNILSVITEYFQTLASKFSIYSYLLASSKF